MHWIGAMVGWDKYEKRSRRENVEMGRQRKHRSTDGRMVLWKIQRDWCIDHKWNTEKKKGKYGATEKLAKAGVERFSCRQMEACDDPGWRSKKTDGSIHEGTERRMDTIMHARTHIRRQDISQERKELFMTGVEKNYGNTGPSHILTRGVAA